MNLNLNPSAGSEFHRSILDAMPYPVLVLEESFRIVDANSAASQVIGIGIAEARWQRPGEVLHCIHSTETQQGCGGAESCGRCPVRASIQRAFNGEYPPRQLVHLIVSGPERMIDAHYLMTIAPLSFENLKLVLVILEDAHELGYVQQVLPICSSCKQVRGDGNGWQSVEAYLSSRLEIHCTHSLCPECAQKFFPEYAHALQIHTEGDLPPGEAKSAAL